MTAGVHKFWSALSENLGLTQVLGALMVCAASVTVVLGMYSLRASAEARSLRELTPSAERVNEMARAGCLGNIGTKLKIYCLDHYPELKNEYIHVSAQARALQRHYECVKSREIEGVGTPPYPACPFGLAAMIDGTVVTEKKLAALNGVVGAVDHRLAELHLTAAGTLVGCVLAAVLAAALAAWLWVLTFLEKRSSVAVDRKGSDSAGTNVR